MLPSYGQLAFDTLLFTVSLRDNKSSDKLFVCNEPGNIRKTLSGPVVMKDNSLMFFSKDGYVLYNQSGRMLDSYSLFKKNKKYKEDDPERMRLAFPANRSTILFYNKIKNGKMPITILAKKLFKDRLKSIKEKDYKYYSNVANNEFLLNLVHNTITNDLAFTYLIIPQLVGFSSITSGKKWWTIDKFYSFSSPLINEEKGVYESFFPGVRAGSSRKKQLLITPIQIFKRDKNWYYSGIHSNVGIEKDRYIQTYYVCDQAGNILCADTLLKQTSSDALLQKVGETSYTTKTVESYVFMPTVDRRGNVFYGVINYRKRKIEVHKRGYYTYRPVSSEPSLAHLVDVEKSVEYTPVTIGCNMKLSNGKTIPFVTIFDEKGKRIVAKARHLTMDEYIVRISRTPYRDIERKLVRKRSELPPEVQAIKDSLINVSSVSCPYTISLSGPKGMIRSFHYTPGEVMLCARVLRLRQSGTILVRVDCESYAEILIFRTDGSFVNRFQFNSQRHEDRKDIIIATEKSPIIEVDYESGKEKFLEWKRMIAK